MIVNCSYCTVNTAGQHEAACPMLRVATPGLLLEINERTALATQLVAAQAELARLRADLAACREKLAASEQVRREVAERLETKGQNWGAIMDECAARLRGESE